MRTTDSHSYFPSLSPLSPFSPAAAALYVYKRRGQEEGAGRQAHYTDYIQSPYSLFVLFIGGVCRCGALAISGRPTDQ